MTNALCVALAAAVDFCIGEPPNRYHPLVLFGRWASWLESGLNRPSASNDLQVLYGFLAWVCAMLPCILGLVSTVLPEPLQTVFAVSVLYFCIGARSLQQHAMAVYKALAEHNLILARQRVGRIVSRQTEHMTEPEVRRASMESVLENGADAVFAPIFWFVLLGPFGALLYRLSNTLDAMWGYKFPRYRYFGYTAARCDDALNWLPARLTALSYTLLGDSRRAWRAWQDQAHLLDSPNAGPVMTAGGGALNIQLGGPANYHGFVKQKPWFGGEQTPENGDIRRATCLVYQTLFCWLLVISAGGSLA
jgi:adenosylcobinamide-phosphate synthase